MRKDIEFKLSNIRKTCLVCGKDIKKTADPYYARRRFCSERCYKKYVGANELF